MIKYLVSGLILLSVTITAAALPTAELTLKVVDEDGTPVEGAKVGIALYGSKNSGVRGLTDKDGGFTGSGSTPNLLGYLVKKDGYYSTGGRYRGFKSISGIFGFRRWQPWNPTVELVLKKKINPIPLYAINRMKGKPIPLENKFFGFDLIARDWVVPYGQGTHRDFLFKLEKHRALGRQDYYVTFTVQFSNEGDGIQSYYDQPNEGSILRLPHNAPTADYLKEVVINRERSPGKRTKPENRRYREDQNYFFRVRTEKDEKGNIVSALYGKIHGGFNMSGFKKNDFVGSISFDYYLNPTPNDTNLEFDTRKNLFTDLTGLEEVVLP